ncbi:hypothetical protein E4T50_02962 [Aureobasidium sp. EXF-12298]|nr:hypothetical protein E4T50_02962 [Aureobasidium sp. EXF-12298]
MRSSSSSARSGFSNHSSRSASSSASPKPTPSFPSPSVYGNLLSPADTPHKRNRFKTLFFAPSIRDSGISLSTPTSDPRFPSPVTPPCFPIPGVPIDEEALVQSELDFLVDELAARYACYDSRDLESIVPDRCDSPTLGYHPVTMASRFHVPLPMRGQNDSNSNSKTRGHVSALPGASHLNSPVNLSIRELATTSTSINAKKTSPRPRPAINPSSPLLGLPHVFRRLAITDPHINGQPIRFLSQDYVAGANSLQVGSCTFMNLPYGADVECGLRVEPNFPRNVSKSQTVILQIVQRVVRVRDGSSVWLLCSEVDVSSSFTAQVREELALAASANVLSNGKSRQKQWVSDDDIWVSLAQQLETDSYAPSTTRLPTHSTNTKTKNTTTPALSDLLSLLTELRFLHRQFFILQPKRSKTGDFDLSVPYLSSSLHTSLLSLPHISPSRKETKQKDTSHGHDTSIYTSNLATNTPLATFINTATFAAKTWVGRETQTPTILREVLSLPSMGKRGGEEEQIGIYGVRIGESWGEGRQGLGCWVCFLVPKGVEKEL